MTTKKRAALQLDDIQRGVLSPRPTPYAATYLLFRVDDPAHGRELMRRVSTVATSAAEPVSPLGSTWVSVALTCHGLRALGVPEPVLATFAWEFRQGMAGRATALGDVGESGPENWEAPLGTSAVHVVLLAVAPDAARLQTAIDRARPAYDHLSGVTAIWRQDCYTLPTETEHFGYRDGVSQPAVEGSGIAGSNTLQVPLKAGEFVLGYPDELGGVQAPQPAELGRNGSYVAIRKLHQRVGAFRRYLRDNAISPEDEELLAAKIMGRWRSGAPLALSPHHDDPALGADPERRNAFLYEHDDPGGFITPGGCHIRRANPRDASVAGEPRLHRMIRRGGVYGPPLPSGVLDDDGADRGLMFTFVGAHLGRQFEFVQSEWMNDGVFFGAGGATDPIAGSHEGPVGFTIPRRPLRRRLSGLPRFVVTRGGEYCFLPGLNALRWLGDLKD
ncbi:Dyp-type peroxidase [Frankia sp. CNm7]|uniref:Dyp-type peroxidase n=1 Tax=Frankia nepalensis TaxID=1836974 RepID=A0A937UPW0_9ACTN|nr:Dyp-type peroxidase [Frankia nepalensis]MBL7496290.1 Dyp-type peroxidase [Frankia nepalensis]MBL7508513.1 Dyp-type peroxidase [Frankia nepalensis]MBL7520246.1 Dyp-type peroxidase [Frankia nepalensis]MBL7627645.1 Dyp-type peroxidase [Frankia nepalensis]